MKAALMQNSQESREFCLLKILDTAKVNNLYLADGKFCITKKK